MAVYLVRHAHAGKRSKWDGPDRERPLSDRGEKQAVLLGQHLAGLEPAVTRVLSSPAVRCVQTVQPLADQLGVEVICFDELAEGGATSVAAALVAGVAVGAGDGSVAACAHGDLVPALVEWWAGEGAAFDHDPHTEKGAGWALKTDGDGRVTAGHYLPPMA